MTIHEAIRTFLTRATSADPAARREEPSTLGAADFLATPDGWMAEEQWLAGLPTTYSDRLGWLWWQRS